MRIADLLISSKQKITRMQDYCPKPLQPPRMTMLNEERLAAYHGAVSLLFAAGKNRKVTVTLIDDRGIESLKVLPLV